MKEIEFEDMLGYGLDGKPVHTNNKALFIATAHNVAIAINKINEIVSYLQEQEKEKIKGEKNEVRKNRNRRIYGYRR